MKPKETARNNNNVDNIGAESKSNAHVYNDDVVGDPIKAELKSKNACKSILVISDKTDCETNNTASDSAGVVNSGRAGAGIIKDINYNGNYKIIDAETTENANKKWSRNCDNTNLNIVCKLNDISECNSNSESISEELGNTRSSTESIGETTSESSELSLSLNSGVGTVIYGSVSSRDVNSFQEEEASKDKARKACAIT